MRHSFIYVSAVTLALPLLGCGGASDTRTGSTPDLKSQAATDLANGTAAGDPCETNAWYGDAVCDSFCPVADTDCTVDGDPVVCATFIEVSDGACGREPTDPCISQDPDCGVTPTPVDPPEPVFCAAVIESPDGTCSRAPDDPCRSQDPDCKDPQTPPDGGYDCDESHAACLPFVLVQPCPDGQSRTVVGDCFGDCVPTDQCAPIDPKPAYDCDTSKITCQTFAPVICPDGTVATVNSDGCYGPCVTPDECLPQDPVVCTMISENPDGVCSRDPNDPCIFQDPDCVQR